MFLRAPARIEGFSSPHTTKPPAWRSSPAQRPRYGSKMRPYLATKFGSRGKFQERCCHGLIASSESERQTVTPEICRRSRGRPPCARGLRRTTAPTAPGCRRGRSHASGSPQRAPEGAKPAVCPAAAGPRSRLSAARRTAFATVTRRRDHSATGRRSVVAQPVGGQQHHLSPRHQPIRQRIQARQRLQHRALLGGRHDPIRAMSWHQLPLRGTETTAALGRSYVVTLFMQRRTKAAFTPLGTRAELDVARVRDIGALPTFGRTRHPRPRARRVCRPAATKRSCAEGAGSICASAS
jgi:hypothetical protein